MDITAAFHAIFMDGASWSDAARALQGSARLIFTTGCSSQHWNHFLEVSEEEERLLQGIMVFSKSPGFAPCRTTGDRLPCPCVFCCGDA